MGKNERVMGRHGGSHNTGFIDETRDDFLSYYTASCLKRCLLYKNYRPDSKSIFFQDKFYYIKIFFFFFFFSLVIVFVSSGTTKVGHVFTFTVSLCTRVLAAYQ